MNSYIKKLEEENRLLNQRNAELEEKLVKKPKRVLLIHEKMPNSQQTSNLIKVIQQMDMVLNLEAFAEEKYCFTSLKDKNNRTGRIISLEEVMKLYD